MGYHAGMKCTCNPDQQWCEKQGRHGCNALATYIMLATEKTKMVCGTKHTIMMCSAYLVVYMKSCWAAMTATQWVHSQTSHIHLHKQHPPPCCGVHQNHLSCSCCGVQKQHQIPFHAHQCRSKCTLFDLVPVQCSTFCLLDLLILPCILHAFQ